MGQLVPFILALVRPVLSRVFMALGLTILTMTGIDLITTQLKGWIVGYLSQLQGNGEIGMAIYSLIMIAGVGTAINIIFGAWTFCAVFWQLTASGRIFAANPLGGK